MKWLTLIALPLALAGCAGLTADNPVRTPPADPAAATSAGVQAPAQTRRPPASARTADQFDATTAEERAQASAPVASGERSLGTTVASLGDPSRVGFWLETPLVDAPTKGRVAFGGRSANVDLIPIEGADTAGSRISLSAMRLIEAPLTDLPTVEVYVGG